MSGRSPLVSLARTMSREHQLRRELMPHIDEPRWMILLEIFVVSSQGGDLPFMSAARAAGVSISTGQRYVHELIKAGLIEHGPSSGDQRITHIRLSEEGETLATQLLTRLAEFRNGGKG